jgi:hypothetical protein
VPTSKTDLNPEGVGHAGVQSHNWNTPVDPLGGMEAMATGSFGFEPRARVSPTIRTTVRPECPECGSTDTRVFNTGRDLDDRPLRDRRCRDCGYRGVTLEDWVTGATFTDVDAQHYMMHRATWLKRNPNAASRRRRFKIIHRILGEFRMAKRGLRP